MPKKEIHPEWYPEAKVYHNGEVIMTVGATQPELSVEIWSGTHPFYTGQQRLVDTEGQVDRFMRRLRRQQEIEDEREAEEEVHDPLAQSIEAIGLSTRAANALTEQSITTVGELFARYEEGGDDGLLAIQGIGQKAMIDIRRHFRAEELIE